MFLFPDPDEGVTTHQVWLLTAVQLQSVPAVVMEKFAEPAAEDTG
jgi:hypothetical protein